MTELAPDRVPPNDIPAEVSVLGAMMAHPPAVPIARELLAEADFYRPAHQLIFKVLSYMADNPARFGPPDLVTIRAALESRGRLEEVGGIQYLIDMVEGVPTAANVEYYANIVKDKAQRREVIIASTQATNDAFGTGETSEIIATVSQAIAGAGNRSRSRGKSSAAAVEANMEAAIAGERISVAWPWKSITKYAKPCAPGAVSVICGEPGSGKSFLFQEAMLCWHRSGIKTAMYHLEKTREYHQTRALGQLVGDSHLLSDEWQRDNPDDARAALAEYSDLLDSYGACVWDDPDGSTTLDNVQSWIAARINEGAG